MTTTSDDARAPETDLPTGGEVLSGGLWTSLSKFIPQLYIVVVSIVAARVLGPAGMGRQSFIAFVELTAVFAITAGVPLALGRFVAASLGARQPDEARRLIRWAWWLEGAGAIVAVLVFVVVAATGAAPGAAWILAGVAASFGILYTVPSTLLLATRRWRAAALVVVATGLVSTVATVVVLALGGGIVGMFGVEAGVAALSLVATTILARRVLATMPARGSAGRPLPTREIRRFAALASVTALLDFVVWRRTEFFFLNHYATDVQIALYSIPFAAVTALARLPEPITRVVLPAVATLSGAGSHERIARGFGRGFRLLLLVAIPLTAAALALGPRTLQLVYGSSYEDTGSVLLILLAPFPLLPLLGLATAVMLGLGKQVVNTATITCAVIVDIVLDLLLIPSHGAIGAAIANASAQAVGSLPMIAYVLVVFGGAGITLRFALRVAVVGSAVGLAAVGGVQALSGVSGVVAGSAAAVLAFLLAARAVRVLDRRDATWLEDNAGLRLRGLVGKACRAWAAAPGA